MDVVHTISELRAAVKASQNAGWTIGLVPTMGALHEGHLSLVGASRRENDVTCVTIFVNPTQFGANEDLSKYPRPLTADLNQLRQRGTNLVFAPAVEELYAPDHSTFVDVGLIACPLEGEFRTTHFRGVATIVLKLLQLVPADRAYFGQKDYQQTLIVRRMVADLNVPVEVRVCPTVREPDGLAMSSRNTYLSSDERQRARALYESLNRAQQLVAGGEREVLVVEKAMHSILQSARINQIDYAVVVDPETLKPLKQITGPALAAIAARVGETRLIDNLTLLPSQPECVA